MADTVTVALVQGGLRGRKVTTKAGITYNSFQGIPYAKPPVGPLRFKPPEPADPWDGVRDALKEGSVSPQVDNILNKGYIGDEDCLFLNVYTTKLPEGAEDVAKPVMVWIHGGGYLMGSSNTDLYGPDYLMAGDIVLVTINYRLGALGFLSTGDSEVPGNLGFKDQVMALRWVQLNIAHFGGDSGNVTIFGESAGGGSVHHLTLSPMSKGLFHRAIAQSGSALHPWSFNDSATARKKAFRLGAAMGCKTESSKELIEFLRKLPIRELIEGADKMLSDEEKHPLPLYFTPTIEKESNNEDKFLPDTPINIISNGKFQKVPFMVGYTSEEGIFVLLDAHNNPEWFESLNQNFESFVSRILYIEDKTEAKTLSDKIKTFYFGDKRISKDTYQEYANFFSDIWFLSGIHKVVEKQVANSDSPVFFYRFSYDGKLSFSDLLFKGSKPLAGASHADDLGYLFHMDHHDSLNLDTEDEAIKLIKRMVKLWTNFAKTGNPTPEDDPLLGVQWKPVTKTELSYLNIDKELKIQKEILHEERQAFWKDFFYH